MECNFVKKLDKYKQTTRKLQVIMQKHVSASSSKSMNFKITKLQFYCCYFIWLPRVRLDLCMQKSIILTF